MARRRFSSGSEPGTKPSSGRFSTTSIRLPAHMEAMMPQNNAACSMARFAGHDPLMTFAPTTSAVAELLPAIGNTLFHCVGGESRQEQWTIARPHAECRAKLRLKH